MKYLIALWDKFRKAPKIEIDVFRPGDILVVRFQGGVMLRVDVSDTEELTVLLPRASAQQLIDNLLDAMVEEMNADES